MSKKSEKSGSSGGGGGNLILLVIAVGMTYLAFGPYEDKVKKFYYKTKAKIQEEVFAVAPKIEKMVETDRASRPVVPKNLDELSKKNEYDRLTAEDQKKLSDFLNESR